MLLRSLAGLAFIVGISGLSGCATTHDRGAVQREWSRNLRELGVVPVFPPREDVCVGDVFLYSFDPDSEETSELLLTPFDRMTPSQRTIRQQIGMSTRWTSLDLREPLQAEYERRVGLPPTPLTATVDNIGTFPQPKDSGSIFVGDRQNPLPDHVNRGRIVAFPEFSATASNQADIKALVPVEAFAAGLNIAYSDIESVTVRVPSAESYGLSVQTVLDNLSPVLAARARSDDEVADMITRAVVVEYERLLRATVQERWTVMRPPSADRRIDELVMQAWISTCKTNLDKFLRWSRASDPALEDKREGMLPIHLVWGDAWRSAAEQSPLGKEIEQKVWLDRVRVHTDLMLSAYSYRRSLGRQVGAGASVLRELNTTHFAEFAREDSPPRRVYLRVITEVFYARALDISVNTKAAVGARGSVTPIVPTPGSTSASVAAQSADASSQVPANTAPPGTAGRPDPRYAVEQSIRQVVAAPGGSVKILSATDRAVAMRRVFERPVAIGTRGVTLAIDVNSGFVVSASSSGGLGPTNTGR